MSESSDPRIAEARAGIDAGAALLDAGRITPAVASFASVVRKFGEDPSVDLQAQVAEAWNYVAFALAEGSPDQKLEAIRTYQDVIERYNSADDRRLRRELANAMFNRAMDLYDLGRSAEAADGFRGFLAAFEDDPGDKANLVPQAWVEVGSCLADLGQKQDALDTFDDVLDRFQHDQSLAARSWMAGALERKAYTLQQDGRLNQAIAVSDELVARFADDPADPVQLHVLVVLCWKVWWLEQLDQRALALDTCHEIVDHFPGEQPPEREASVEWARKRLAAAAA